MIELTKNQMEEIYYDGGRHDLILIARQVVVESDLSTLVECIFKSTYDPDQAYAFQLSESHYGMEPEFDFYDVGVYKVSPKEVTSIEYVREPNDGLLALLLMKTGPVVVSEDEVLAATTSNIFTVVTTWDEETKSFTMEAR